MMCLIILQAKAQFEKTKQTLESENADLAAEIKQLSTARQEAERKRKQTEQQLADVTARLIDLERTKGDVTEKTSKLQVFLLL